MNFNFILALSVGILLAILIVTRFIRLNLDRKSNIMDVALEISSEGFFIYHPKSQRWESLRRENLSFLGYTDALPEEISLTLQKEAVRCINEKILNSVALELTAAGGKPHLVSLKTRPLGNDENDEPRHLVVVTDRMGTVKKEAVSDEEKMKLVQMEKYSVLRDLGAGVSHEINNPLAIILGRAQTLKMKLARGAIPPADVIDTLEKIEVNVKRISKIVMALRLMTKDSSQEESDNLTVQSLFEDLSSVWAERLKNKGFEFKVASIDPDIEVWGKRSLLITALFNLVSNSYEALHEKENPWIHIEAKVDGKKLTITVTDSGKGIPAEARKRIFDPFFTTRDAAKSSGLGLSVAKGIFEVHKGSVTYDSDCSNTRFVIHLPLSEHERKIAA